MLVRPVYILPALAALLLLTAGPVAAGELTFRDVMPDAGTPGGPAALAWNHDGTSLAYLHDDGQGSALWVQVVGEESPTRRLAESTLDGGIDAYHWAPASNTLLLESGGDLFCCRPPNPGPGASPRPTARRPIPSSHLMAAASPSCAITICICWIWPAVLPGP
jgi:hypothetical protein